MKVAAPAAKGNLDFVQIDRGLDQVLVCLILS